MWFQASSQHIFLNAFPRGLSPVAQHPACATTQPTPTMTHILHTRLAYLTKATPLHPSNNMPSNQDSQVRAHSHQQKHSSGDGTPPLGQAN